MNKRNALYCLIIYMGVTNAASQNPRIPDVIVKRPVRATTISGATKQIITRQMMSATGATSVADVLKTSVALQLHDTSGSGADVAVSLRGFGANASSNTLILLDGVPTTNPDLMAPDVNVLPLESIRHIEIMSGSESVLYGDQAVGGVINLITDHQAEKNIRLQCGVGSYRARDCHARWADVYRSVNYQASVTHHVTDNYREHNEYENTTLMGSGFYQQPSYDMLIDYKFSQERTQYPGALTGVQVDSDRRQANNDTDYFKNNNQYLHVNVKKPLREAWRLTTDVFVSGMNGNGVLSSAFGQSRRSVFLKPMVTGKADRYQLESGIDVRLDDYHLGSSFGVTNNHQRLGGLFSLVKIAATPDLSFSIGARGALQATQLNTDVSAEAVNRAFVTTLGADYQINNDFSVYARRAGSFRFPKAEESTSGRQPLRPQRGDSYEGGLVYQADDQLLEWSIYQINLRDEIAFDPLQTPENPFGSNENLAPTKRLGSSLAVKYPIHKKLIADATVNLVNAIFRSGVNSGNHIPLVADVMAHGGLLYRFDAHWQLYAEAALTGREFAANDNANVGSANGGFTLYNFNLRYRYQAITAAFHVNNIFNKHYYLYTVYQVGVANEYFYPAPDRNFMLTVSGSFD